MMHGLFRRQPPMRRDKRKVIDEVWDDARIKGFLDKRPPDLPGDPDFHVLLFAYQSMRVADFERFLRFFVQAGRNIGACNAAGQDVAAYIARHRQARPYLEALAAAVTPEAAT